MFRRASLFAILRKDTTIQEHLARLSEQCTARGKVLASLNPTMLFSKSGEAYDGWYRCLNGYIPPHPLISVPFESYDELIEHKEKAKDQRHKLIREMVSLQEEIDWYVYAACGLIPLNHSALGIGVFSIENIWQLTPGHRPFELASINAGPPAEWETKRRELWITRLDAVKQNSHIGSIEHSLFKRRWPEIDYEKEFAEACYEWLREKAEFYLQHSAGGGPIDRKSVV